MESKNTDTTVVTLDGDNTYPDCECCGDCCHIAVLAIRPDELATMHKYIEDHDVKPIDRGYERCPLRSDEGTCMIWEARPQICKLHNCRIPRKEILNQNPDLEINTGSSLVVLFQEFIGGEAPIETR